MEQNIRRKGHKQILQQHMAGEMEYLTFQALTDTKVVEHMMSTRLGGASKNQFSTVNFGYSRGDDKRAVDENYRRVAAILHGDCEHIVCTDQTHTTNVKVVTKEDCGKGVVRPKDYHDVDGLITNEPNIILAFFYADCVPLFFVDPVKKAIGVAHSGWRGTVGKIGKCVVEQMQKQYGTDPKDLICGIGTSICQDCYEVSQDVALTFQEAFSQDCVALQKAFDEKQSFYQNLPYNSLFSEVEDASIARKLLYPTENDKYQLNLWMANFCVMLEAGVLPEHISVTDICTCCNPEYLFSHRKNGEQRGNLGAFMKLKDSSCPDMSGQ